MAKLRSLVVAAWFWALTLAVAQQPRAETLRAKMDEDPAVRLFTVEFRTRLDHHGRLLTMKIVKVVDGKTGKSVRMKVSRQFIAIARARVEQDLALPHDTPPPAQVYNAFLYSPAYPDVLFIDPDRDITNQQPGGEAPPAPAAPQPTLPQPTTVAPAPPRAAAPKQLEFQF